jgi:hypothetical protein
MKFTPDMVFSDLMEITSGGHFQTQRITINPSQVSLKEFKKFERRQNKSIDPSVSEKILITGRSVQNL